MKEDDLIKKLENTELPDIRLQGHQRRLRMALLEHGYRRRQREVAIFDLVKSIFKGVKDTMIKGLVSRQPVWKTATVGILALALVLGLSLTIPSLSSESAFAQAAEIAQNSPEVREVLGPDGEVQVVKVIQVVDDKGIVIAKGEMGVVSASVDLETKTVTEVVTLTELTPAGEQMVIDIAKADPRVKELLDAGATIGPVTTSYAFGTAMNPETGEMEEINETLVKIQIEGSDNHYTAQVDLAAGELVRLLEMPHLGETLDEAPDFPQESFFYYTPDGSIGEEGQ